MIFASNPSDVLIASNFKSKPLVILTHIDSNHTAISVALSTVDSRLSCPVTGPPEPGTDFQAPGSLKHHRFRRLLERFSAGSWRRFEGGFEGSFRWDRCEDPPHTLQRPLQRPLQNEKVKALTVDSQQICWRSGCNFSRKKLYTPPPVSAHKAFSGEGAPAAEIFYAPLFYTPSIPRSVFSGVGWGWGRVKLAPPSFAGALRLCDMNSLYHSQQNYDLHDFSRVN